MLSRFLASSRSLPLLHQHQQCRVFITATNNNIYNIINNTSSSSSSLFRSTLTLFGTKNTGKVLQWDDQRNFGFIQDDESGDQFFCHKNDLKIDGSRAIVFLRPDDKVSFDFADNPVRGPGSKKCVNVTQADGRAFGRATGDPIVKNRRDVVGFVSYMKIGSAYGFLTTDDEPESRIFFHANDVKNGPLYPKDRVKFDVIVDTEKEGRAKAIAIEKIVGDSHRKSLF